MWLAWPLTPPASKVTTCNKSREEKSFWRRRLCSYQLWHLTQLCPALCIWRVVSVLHNEALCVNSCYRNITKQTRHSGARWLHSPTAWTTEGWRIACSHWQDALVTYYWAKRLLSEFRVICCKLVPDPRGPALWITLSWMWEYTRMALTTGQHCTLLYCEWGILL